MDLRYHPVSLASVVLISAIVLASPSTAEDNLKLVVARVESEPNSASYVVRVGDARAVQGDSLNLLHASHPGRLAFILAPDVAIGAVSELLSIASKLGCFGPNVRFFMADAERSGLKDLGVVSGEWLAYTEAAGSLEPYFR